MWSSRITDFWTDCIRVVRETSPICFSPSPTAQAVLNFELETTCFAYSSESSILTMGRSVFSMIISAGSERLIIFPTENASSVVASIETQRACAALITRSPTGAPSAMIIAAIPADIRASWAGSLSPTIAMSSGVIRERVTCNASMTV